MAKSDLGTKRICPTTGKKFYDLNKSPVISPYTGEVVPIAPVTPPRMARGAAAAAPSMAADMPEPAENENLVSLEEADAEENSGKVKAAVPESEDDIEVDETIEGDEDAQAQGLTERLAGAWSLPTALAFLAWFVFAPQCLSTIAVARRETNGWKWPLFMVGYLFALAWIFAGLTYWAATAAGL